MFPVADRLAVDKDDHVVPQRTMLVEHIAASPWIGSEEPIECFADRPPRQTGGQALDVSLDVLGEANLRHELTPAVRSRDAESGAGAMRAGVQNSVPWALCQLDTL